MEKHAKQARFGPNNDGRECEKDQGGQHGPDRRGRRRLTDGHALFFHEIDLDYATASGKRGDIGYKNIYENEFDDVCESNAESHRPDDAI